MHGKARTTNENYSKFIWMLIETMLQNVTEVMLRHTAVMMWQRWHRDNTDDGTLKFYVWEYPQRTNTTRRRCKIHSATTARLDHRRYSDLLACCPAAYDRFRLALCQTSKPKSKLSTGECRTMSCPLFQVLSNIACIYRLVYSSYDWLENSNIVLICIVI